MEYGFHHSIRSAPRYQSSAPGSIKLLQKIHHENPEYIIEQGKYWAIVQKQGPYSDRDFMVLYVGERQISHIMHLTANEQAEFEEFMEKYARFVQEHAFEELKNGTTSLVSGMNLAPHPGPKASQTIALPHFHFSLMRNESFDSNGLQVHKYEINPDDPDHRKKLGIGTNSSILTQYVAKELGASLGRNLPLSFIVELPSQLYFASKENVEAFQEIQKEVWEFLVEGYKHIPELQVQDTEAIGASFSITYDRVRQRYVVLCRVTEDTPSAGTGLIEMQRYTLSRVVDIVNAPTGDQSYYKALHEYAK